MASVIASLEACFGFSMAGKGATPEPSFQAVSAGRIKVATWPGAASAAAIAAAPSAATDFASGEVRTQDETVLAAPSMSEVSGAL